MCIQYKFYINYLIFNHNIIIFKVMKSWFTYLVAVFVFFICSAWGFQAHKLINKTAVFTLPVDVSGFYKEYIDYITEHAIDADKRCYVDTAESPRHYIDLDRFEASDSLDAPIHWSAAVEKFTERRLIGTGIVPWHINRSYRNLVQAMQANDLNRILRYSADLGHYIADAHVPLHTTQNYNGQYTNQVGIHAFWESRLPELFADSYNFFVGRATYIEDPLTAAWKIIQESHALVDTVLSVEAELSDTFAADRKYAYEQRNRSIVRVYSEAYSTAYHDALKGMVERRMQSSIITIGSFWYSAWVDAGQPDIRKLSKRIPSLEVAPQPTTEQKIIGREEWHE